MLLLLLLLLGTSAAAVNTRMNDTELAKDVIATVELDRDVLDVSEETEQPVESSTVM